MKIPTIAKISGNVGKQLVESEYLLPVLYLTGAAGGLAYGGYALVSHIRDRRPGTSTGDVAKIGLPMLVGSGLAYLGVCNLRADKPKAMMAETASDPRRSRPGKRSMRGARGRRSTASSAS